MTTITFIGAGSTVFTKNIAGDVLQRKSVRDATIRLMDINPQRLEESEIVVGKMAQTLGGHAKVETYTDQRRALDGADFVVCCFQVGGYDPCTITDFEVPKKFGLRQTIADTLGIGGIMRGIRTVPHLWSICQDMMEVCPDAIMMQYVNPMAINTWAIGAKFPEIRQVGLCHSVQGTAAELARDLDLASSDLRYTAAGINHMAFYLNFEHRQPDGTYRDLYPDLRRGYLAGEIPKPSTWNPRCPNKVRYEMLMKLGYFVTESSEHFAEYVPYFIKRDRPDLIEKFGIPLDEYPKRCIEQIERWDVQAQQYREANEVIVEPSHEYASDIVNSVVTGEPSVIYGNVRNTGLIPQLPDGCAVEVPTLVDDNGLHPTVVRNIPPQLIALMRTNINVQDLTVQALLTENPEHIYHAAMMDPHTAAELDLDQIWDLTHDLLAAHGDWLPEWARPETRKSA
ncbi:alpha-glucosidase/alpha-galactosidase [Ponticoccus sp. SC2-23]|uniref:alpha-glucosidase/alpha-galactosidase n=1 Tax=Alexandriicola marinus TaxID=2081710 RepID=UPI000FDB75B9|nr:alpha-glucosidase/alpha-galactosidase [Alexandriicola marinus]MBM1220789.1 alpha-glucosidase/alpha-galactosidase [Ponticoccus sp. SC6-9]MBM1225359.1 alpha-glucosidase/alpha-galactosidase [Ponticoccus sp. SC6-15]MBM1227542.1 alpha-glucosidase/alpha-galactosidase [Ponticoccus sp. SC6-38]MBM1234820.1 alpha-glucosidase/alpha-galactosidase [Ponticoccus sp. SC6-45]MBM1238044.1 alpha-glucosidase/alpha-galactosidase [Ponticoccus sp. SC6-49]MBM1244323.1 alpha-glucosidase/alpha-galactosidase [Pontic